MRYSCPAPTSLVRSSTATIATYDTCVFISADPYGRESPLQATATSPWRIVRAGVLPAIFIALAILLAVAAARADTVNQATLVRFTNKVSFGAAQPARSESTLDGVLARVAAIRTMRNPPKADADGVFEELRNVQTVTHARTASFRRGDRRSSVRGL
jgi:hypothetical protein